MQHSIPSTIKRSTILFLIRYKGDEIAKICVFHLLSVSFTYLQFHEAIRQTNVIVFSGPFINTLRPTQNGRHLADDTFKRIFLNENVRISIEISLKFAPKGPINNIPALV